MSRQAKFIYVYDTTVNKAILFFRGFKPANSFLLLLLILHNYLLIITFYFGAFSEGEFSSLEKAIQDKLVNKVSILFLKSFKYWYIIGFL